MKRSIPLVLAAFAGFGCAAPGTDPITETGGASHGATPGAMRAAAIAFLDALDEEARAKVSFAMDDSERKAWSNLPQTGFRRLGVSFGEMTPQQRVLAHRLIASPLSSQGYLKTSGIMHLDEILRGFAQAARPDRAPPFGHDFYWIGLFGDPRDGAAWGWQLDGHHLALNFTVVGDRVSVTPAFLGTDPAEVRRETFAGWRILGAEEDKGARLLASLDAEQRQRALLPGAVPRDVITGPGRGDLLTERVGLPAVDMTPAQRELLLQLLDEYAHNLEHDLAHAQLARIRAAGIDAIHFAWAGSGTDEPFYYRVHGPTVLIEFDNSFPPGRSQGPINHVHTVWRDLEDDYGEDLLRRHYAESPHHRGQ